MLLTYSNRRRNRMGDALLRSSGSRFHSFYKIEIGNPLLSGDQSYIKRGKKAITGSCVVLDGVNQAGNS